MGSVQDTLVNLLKMVICSTEADNFSYRLAPMNRDHLACFVALATNRPLAEIEMYMSELETDVEVHQHFNTVMAGRLGSMDLGFLPGRRLGWYAIVRAIKPKVVVETGVHNGLGALTLAAALLRNRVEGQPGRYYGTDISPTAGGLFSGRFAETGTILRGDSIESLEKLDEKIDLFVNDSDHSPDYEAAEYRIVDRKLTPKAIIIGDNAGSGKLLQYVRETGREFMYFRESPVDTWCLGAGMAIARWPLRPPTITP